MEQFLILFPVMDWVIKNMSRRCAVTNEEFKDGDSVICLMVRLNNGEIVRFDVLKANIFQFRHEGTILGQWMREISSGVSGPQDEMRKIASQEEFFLSLYEGESSSDKDTLKQILSLLLERKRILRFSGLSHSGFQRFLHIRSRKEYLVPMKEITPEDFISVENIF